VHGKHGVAGSNPAPGFMSDPAAPTVAYLDIVSGPGAGTGHVVEGKLNVGRGRSADLALDDPAVSSEHASISVEGLTLVIEDLGSSNGTFVNGERIEDAVRLGVGDRIRVGDTEIAVRLESGEPDLRTPTEPTELHPGSAD
jgi:pSer/pThr/pTyr-binding forkhead associated (FHA) protein